MKEMGAPDTLTELVDEETLCRLRDLEEFDETLDLRIQRQPGLFWRFERANEEARDEMRRAFLLVEHVCREHGIELPWISREYELAFLRDPDRYREDRPNRAIGRLESHRQIMDEDLARMPDSLKDFLDPTRQPGYDPDFGQHGYEGWEVFALFSRKLEDLEWELHLLQPDAPEAS